MATLKITGGESLDGDYEMTLPTTLDMMEYRKRLGITPAELGTIMSEGALESVAVIAYATLRKAGNTDEDLADRVVRLPMGAIATEDGDGDEEVPPVQTSGDASKKSAEPASSGPNSESDSGTLVSIPSRTGDQTSDIAATSARATTRA